MGALTHYDLMLKRPTNLKIDLIQTRMELGIPRIAN